MSITFTTNDGETLFPSVKLSDFYLGLCIIVVEEQEKW